MADATDLAALRIRFVVEAGFETIGTCDASSCAIVAFARLAMNRCVAGGIARSCVAMRDHEGIVFQAGSPDDDPKALLGEGGVADTIGDLIVSRMLRMYSASIYRGISLRGVTSDGTRDSHGCDNLPVG